MIINQNTNILALLGDDTGCGQYRIIRPFSWLKKLGYNFQFTNRINDQILAPFDIFIVQRQHKEPIINAIYNQMDMGKKVYAENDDALEHIRKSNPSYIHYAPGTTALKNYLKFLKSTDGMMASTQIIKDNYININSNIEVWKNCIDLSFRDWKHMPFEEKDKSKFIIGWMGSASHKEDIEIIGPVISEVMKMYKNVYFKLNGQPEILQYIINEFHVDKDRCLNYPFSDFNTYQQFMRDYHLGLAPIIDDKFNNCKSTIKLLEYGILQIPYLASYVEPYKEHYDNHQDGFVVNNTFNNWLEKIIYIINNYDEAIEKAKMCQNNIINNYTIENGGAIRYMNTLQNLINKDNTKKERQLFESSFKNVGRNDPCPCGSGKKYKKCCYLK